MTYKYNRSTPLCLFTLLLTVSATHVSSLAHETAVIDHKTDSTPLSLAYKKNAKKPRGFVPETNYICADAWINAVDFFLSTPDNTKYPDRKKQ